MIHSRNFWKSSHNLTFSLFLFCLICSGCARTPWTDSLDAKQADSIVQFLQSDNLRAESCPESIDGDISLSYRNFFDKKNMAGYFQIISPSFIKLVVSNPFGQPILILTSDQKSFQLINTMKRMYIAGSLYSYGLQNDIPLALLRGNWQDWIRGTISVKPSTITNVRGDAEDRGTWITAESETEGNLLKTHLLINPEEGVLLSRIIEDDKGNRLSEFTYNDWESVGACRQPYTVRVTGLEYHTEITIKLSEVLIAEKVAENEFLLTAPANYLQQIIP